MRVKSFVASGSMVCLSMLASCDGSNGPSPTGSITVVPSSVQSTAGAAYVLSVFAEAPGTLRPDDLLQMGQNIFVLYQDNNDNPDGTIVAGTSPQSQVIEYDMNANVLHTFNVPGHPDGLLAHDATTVWVGSNEDAAPLITTINMTTNAMATYSSDAATLPHGGGLDDMKVIGGVVYASGSNPTLTSTPVPNLTPYSTDSSGATGANGVNTGPAIYAISLNSSSFLNAYTSPSMDFVAR